MKFSDYFEKNSIFRNKIVLNVGFSDVFFNMRAK